ncbi:hypothetical protein Tco_1351978 [Tanacetum coccineum]
MSRATTRRDALSITTTNSPPLPPPPSTPPSLRHPHHLSHLLHRHALFCQSFYNINVRILQKNLTETVSKRANTNTGNGKSMQEPRRKLSKVQEWSQLKLTFGQLSQPHKRQNLQYS